MSAPASKILAVDDEADFEALIAQRFRREIRAQEFAFRFARHGEEALSVLAGEPDIELMLVDINMPVMDGLTLLARLRDQRSAVRAIIVSAYGDMSNLRTAMNRGAFDFVTKPVDMNDLEITIRKTLADVVKLREVERLRAAAERARTNLSRYFSPNIVELLAAQDEPLGAVRRQTVAALFCDIVGFTRMAEAMTPEAVMTLLRGFHERMTAQIFACGGTIEKYIGDEIFAVFGIPTASAEDPANALRCADMMLAAIDRWNKRARGTRGAAAGGRHRPELWGGRVR
jgi:adenylate cyclase